MSVAPRLRRAGGWAILGGVLLELGHFSGVGFWAAILRLLTSRFPGNVVIGGVGLVILLIASLGGIAVIIAGVLLLRGHARTARWLIGFGAGFGLLSFLIYLGSSILQGDALLSFNTTIVLVGLFLAIYARGMAR